MIWDEGIVGFEYPDPDAPKFGLGPRGMEQIRQPDTTSPIVLSLQKSLQSLWSIRSSEFWNTTSRGWHIPEGTTLRPIDAFRSFEYTLKSLGIAIAYPVRQRNPVLPNSRASYVLAVKNRGDIQESEIFSVVAGLARTLDELREFFDKHPENESCIYIRVRKGMVKTEPNNGPKSPEIFDAIQADVDRLRPRLPMTVMVGGSSLHVFATEPMVAAITALDAIQRYRDVSLSLKNGEPDLLIVRDDETGSETSIRVNRSQFAYTAHLLDVASPANVVERRVNEEEERPAGAEVEVTR